MNFSKDDPPVAGWYLVSIEAGMELLRYWSGSTWSKPCFADDTAEVQEHASATPAEEQHCIVWREMPASRRPTARVRDVDRLAIKARAFGIDLKHGRPAA